MNREKTKEYLFSLNIKGLTAERLEAKRWDLSGLNFNYRDLSQCYLRDSDCTGSTFIEANLQKSDCAWCDFTGAIFCEANLNETNFFEANCKGADFSGADINKASFDFACLENAAFLNAKLGRTNTKISIAKARIYDNPLIYAPAQLFYYRIDRLVRRLASRVRMFFLKTLGFIHRDIK